jgi:hypothetical protein
MEGRFHPLVVVVFFKPPKVKLNGRGDGWHEFLTCTPLGLNPEPVFSEDPIMGYTTSTFLCIQSHDLLYEAAQEVAINHTSSHKSFVILLPFWLNIETRCRNLAI